MPLLRVGQVSGSFQISGSINNVTTASFNSFTASYHGDSSSFNYQIGSVYASESNYLPTSSFVSFSASVHNDSASFNSRIISSTGSITDTGSLLVTSSFYSYTASTSVRINNVFGSQSNYTPTSSFNSLSGSYSTDSGSFNTRILAITGSGGGSNTGTIPILSGSVSSALVMDINLSSVYNLYSMIKVVFYGVVPQTTNTNLYLRLSSDGTNYDSGSGAYQWSEAFANTAAQAGSVGGATSTATQIQIADAVGNSAGQQTAGVIRLFNPGASTFFPTIEHDLSVSNNGGPLARLSGAGQRLTAQVTKGIRFLMSSGNISGTWRVYGYI